MKFEEFLNKETPKDGGCMLCLAKYKVENYNPLTQANEYVSMEEYMLVERIECANGYIFLINKRFHYDYDFTWDEQTPWEILYKNVKG